MNAVVARKAAPRAPGLLVFGMVAAVSTWAAPGGVAFAQDAGAPAATGQQTVISLNEIVVTATRRESKLQDVGIAVTALSGDTLRQANIVTTSDIALKAPGLQMVAGISSPTVGLVSIRGVAQNDFAAHLESSNAFYVDNVYRPSTGTNVQNMYDVERVEVLKGPQGTLFGRNATGGLIHVLTKEPESELGGYASVTVGDYNQISAEGMINTPLGEQAAARFAIYTNHHDGYIKNSAGPDQAANDTLAMRGKLVLEPSDAWRIKLQGEWYRISPNPAGAAYAKGGTLDANGQPIFREPVSYTDSGYVDADGDPQTGAYNYAGNFDRTNFVALADISYTTDAFSLTSITSYETVKSHYISDNDLSPYDMTIFSQNFDQRHFTQELRLNADLEKARFTGGLYYIYIDGDYFQSYQINNLGNYNQILAPIPNILIPIGFYQYADYTLKTKSWSVFSQVEYDVAEQLTVTAGLRYTRDSKDYYYFNSGPGDPTTLGGAGATTDDSSEGGVSARLQMDYRATPDWLLYASYNRGYKAFNYNAGFGGAAKVSDVKFKGEELNAYEVGSKLDFWSNRGRFNIATFYYDYKDYQAFDQRGTNFILSNADATIYGLDADLMMRPGAGIDLSFGVSLIETKVKDIIISNSPTDVEAPQAPKHTFNFAASKTVETSLGSFRTGIDGQYVDHYFAQLNNAEVTKVGNFWTFNARVTYTPPSGQWELAAFVNNMFDKDRLIFAYDITFAGQGLVPQIYDKPRWFGASARFNF